MRNDLFAAYFQNILPFKILPFPEFYWNRNSIIFLVNDAIPIKNSFNRFRLKKNLIVDYFVE